MKNFLLLLFLVISSQGFSQINRFSKPVTPARYNPTSLSEMAAPILMKKKLDEERECRNLLNLVKSNLEGTKYSSPTSEAIDKVTFYTLNKDGEYYYFATVCFKDPNSYGINCKEYIYNVASDTESKYSNNYRYSAGDAFWKYIQPYRKNLPCGPDF